MSQGTAYEIHGYRGGAWKIQAFFDDKDLAMLEARRMEESRRYPSVRVVEERFDPASGEFLSRTIYRTSAVDAHNERVLAERAEVRREVEKARQDQKRDPARRQRRKRPAEPSASSTLTYLLLLGKAVAILGLGAAALILLQQLGG